MPSKGVQAYTYIAAPGCAIELSVPGHTVVKHELHQFWTGGLEVDTRNLPPHDRSAFLVSLRPPTTTGRFTFRVLHAASGTVVTEQHMHVNARTGAADEGTMVSAADTHSILHRGDPDVIVSFGFYEAGQGCRHQCYITVTPNYADWMGRVAPPDGPRGEDRRPFRHLVLPAAHDVGMNSMQNCNALLRHAGGAVVRRLVQGNGPYEQVLAEMADTLSGPGVAAIAPAIVASLAITQKDPLSSMLALGARYFEFRPAFVHRDVRQHLPDKLYFQHSAIPGMAYDEFLEGVVVFLMENPTEIVVVQNRWDGVPAECKRPSDQQLTDYLHAALLQANGTITAGTLDDLRTKTIHDLRHATKRLLMLTNVNDALATYTDAGNATLTGDSIAQGFGAALLRQLQQQHPPAATTTTATATACPRSFINIQCQATASHIPRAVASSVLEASASNSCLLATKPICDAKTLPWVRDNVLRACGGGEELVVVMNDFFCGATADVAVGLSRQRLAGRKGALTSGQSGRGARGCP